MDGLLGIWTGNSIIALCFVLYWIFKYPDIQKNTLLFRYHGYDEIISSCITVFFYLLAFSLPIPVIMMINA